MSEITIFLPPAGQITENPPLFDQEEGSSQKEFEKKQRKAPLSISNKTANVQNSKKIDTTLYKKVFFNNFKEVCNSFFPQTKNFSSEKYQNFKNIYHKIYFYKRGDPEWSNQVLDSYLTANKRSIEIKKINQKNNILRVLIQKIENNQNKVSFKQIAEEIGKEVKADYLEKLYDSVDITEIKDYDKDKTLDNFLQRHQIKENKKRTRRQMESNMSNSPEKHIKIEDTMSDLKKSPSKKQKYHSKVKPLFPDFQNPETQSKLEDDDQSKSFLDFNLDQVQNSSFLTFNNARSSHGGQIPFDSASINSDYSKTKINFLESVFGNDTLGENNMDVNETNLIKLGNRNILDKLNRFCAYDFTQTNALIPHICIPEKKKHHSSKHLDGGKKVSFYLNSLYSYEPRKTSKNHHYEHHSTREYYVDPQREMGQDRDIVNIKKENKDMSNPIRDMDSQNRDISKHDRHHSHKSREYSHRNREHKSNQHHRDLASKHSYNPSLSEDNYPSSLLHYPVPAIIPNQLANPETFFAGYQPIPVKVEPSKGTNFPDNHSNGHSSRHNTANFIGNSDEIAQERHSNSKQGHSSHISHRHEKHSTHSKKSRKSNEKKSLQDASVMNSGPIYPSFDRNESLVSKGMSFPAPKTETFTSYPQPQQQYFSLVSLEKDNRRPQMPQIYQTQPYRQNAYFYNAPQDNSGFMNNNVIQTNNFCFQAGNTNHFVGVNYPGGVQNIAFKPNGYQQYGVLEINDPSNSQYGVNYLNERAFAEKHRNGGEYFKTPYYPYNGQN